MVRLFNSVVGDVLSR